MSSQRLPVREMIESVTPGAGTTFRYDAITAEGVEYSFVGSPAEGRTGLLQSRHRGLREIRRKWRRDGEPVMGLPARVQGYGVHCLLLEGWQE